MGKKCNIRKRNSCKRRSQTQPIQKRDPQSLQIVLKNKFFFCGPSRTKSLDLESLSDLLNFAHNGNTEVHCGLWIKSGIAPICMRNILTRIHLVVTTPTCPMRPLLVISEVWSSRLLAIPQNSTLWNLQQFLRPKHSSGAVKKHAKDIVFSCFVATFQGRYDYSPGFESDSKERTQLTVSGN